MKLQKRRIKNNGEKSRSPHGERGLKCMAVQTDTINKQSLPARGAWIEIVMQDIIAPKFLGRSPHGERGLKYMKYVEWGTHGSRSPHGERGLKCYTTPPDSADRRSLPARGAWIEISFPHSASVIQLPSLPARGAWIEINPQHIKKGRKKSLPARGAWIEMYSWLYRRLDWLWSLPARGAWIEISLPNR